MVTYSLPSRATQENISQLGLALCQHSLSYLDKPGFQAYSIDAVYQQQKIAGIIGLINWNWLYIKALWVDSEYRNHKIGSSLLKRMEDFAILQGCQYAHLDTFSFQARDFYPRFGYELFACLPDYPPGHSRYFYKKKL